MFPALRTDPDRVTMVTGDLRYRVHRAMRALLTRLAASRPVVLCLDDLHWADVASVEVILDLVRHPPVARVLLLLAWRDGQAPALADALAVADPGRPRVEVALTPLSEKEVDELLGDSLEPAARTVIYHESGGNPLYAQQLATAASGPTTSWLSADAQGVPEVVLVGIRGEIERLPSESRTLAHGAAVAGHPFGLQLAAACAGLGESRALAAIDDLLAGGIVRSADSPRRFVFRHPIVRRAVYDTAPRGWRFSAHQRAAHALERWGAPAAWRAHHVALSAPIGDADAAALLLQAAGEVKGHAQASAARWLEAGLAILPGSTAQPRLRRQLLAASAEALGAIGDLESAHAALREALNLTPGDDPDRIGLLSRLVRVEHLLGRWEEGRARLLKALEPTPGSRVADRCALRVELALSALFWLDFAGAADWAGQAARCADRVDGPLYVAASALLAFVPACAERIAAAAPVAHEAARAFDLLSDEQLAERPESAYYLGRAEFVLEDFKAAERHLRRGIAVARAGGGSPQLSSLTLEHIRTLVAVGRLVEAGELAELAVGTARLSGAGWFLSGALSAQMEVLGAVGELGRATEAGRESVALLETTAAAELALSIQRRLAMVELERGRPERFLAELTRLGTPDSGLVEPGTRCQLFEALTRAALEVDRLEAARGWAQCAQDAAQQLGIPLSGAYADRAQARVLHADGDTAGALSLFGQAAERAAGTGSGLEAARSQALAAQALADAGDRAPAIDELRRVAELLGSFGALGERARLIRRLRSLGVRIPTRASGTRRRTGVDALSRRELEVAEHVALGHTNRQIAAGLFLSEKTVETHLARISAKLEVSGRAAVAAAPERSRRPESPTG